MPKLVAVVGGKHSGKTTIIENLLSQLKTRGYRVGTVKEMVRIPTLDTPETETDRYTTAGAEIVVAVPREETVVFLKNRLSLPQILLYLHEMDYVLLEGFEKEKTLPKIIAAKTAQEAKEFQDGLALALSGIIADSTEETSKASELQLPLLGSVRDAEKLADLVEQKAFDKLPDLPHCGECEYESCYELAKALVRGDAKADGCVLAKKKRFILEVNGVRIPLKAFPEQIFQSTLEGMIESLEFIPKIKTVKIEIEKE
ncbi:MAG: molybdopterin-guanine dinucleotide biosynthesis protein B [Candidatus Bathyarchaeota archaeon]|nr:molybdopterin-guanine dinucleotide biosynthesis protein B [Candidatus Bathyarchaeota archaeon]